MRKTFKELVVGDTLFVWWLDTLYGYPITEATLELTLEEVNETRVIPTDEFYLRIATESGFEKTIDSDFLDSESFIDGFDTPHKYKIIGTSKTAVKKLLTETLQRDIERLMKDRDKWLGSMADFRVGSKIWFEEEKKPYIVRACDERYLVCTKPFNLRKTVFYTMVDLKEEIRGTDGYSIGPYDYESDEDCNAYLKELQNGDIHISWRNRIPLKIKKVKE